MNIYHEVEMIYFSRLVQLILFVNLFSLSFLQGKRIHVHKAILMIRCTYFNNMFSSNWEESSKNEIEVSLFSYNVYEVKF